jgi:8-oxo-dGTP pyrophosphatase MutT (NUDIX family)
VGNPHGAAAICFAGPDEVVLVSQDGDSWGFPGGRPESGESWRATLEREVSEEACATVSDATLLGFVHGKCIDGGELGLELVRSAWRADVSLEEWRPRHEMTRRAIVPAASALEHIDVPTGLQPIYRRWMREALR